MYLNRSVEGFKILVGLSFFMLVVVALATIPMLLLIAFGYLERYVLLSDGDIGILRSSFELDNLLLLLSSYPTKQMLLLLLIAAIVSVSFHHFLLLPKSFLLLPIRHKQNTNP